MKYSIFLISMIIVVASSTSCQVDYQCGNVPYSLCFKNFNMLPGIGRDTSGNIVLLGNFNSSSQGLNYIATLPAAGGSITPGYAITTDANSGSGYSKSTQLYTFVTSLNQPYIAVQKNNAPYTGPYFQNGTFNGVWALKGYTLGLGFDDINKRTYYCDGNVHRIDKIVLTEQERFQGAMDLYAGQNCNFIGAVGNDLYMALINYNDNGTTTTVYKGSISCANCPASSLTKVATLNFQASGFSLSATHMYFSAAPGYLTPNAGLIQLPLSGDMIALRYIVSEPVGRFVFDQSGDWIYYQTADLATIKKVGPISANHPQVSVLYDRSNPGSSGNCGCTGGMQGAQCQTCSGQIQWVNSFPQCIAVSNGNPATCQADYQCANLPYTSCQYATCQCVNGFTGAQCQTCTGTVTWNNGVPTCKYN
ncbi:EGF-like domain-containing protein [Heterostelium album PN500]|uniref:EGF-like domain-containing protein n=1 Tax=Heterostelium pallidum (strain ATCC 26659 / Pp 5 / PN500) TaxID=670386 RepID=D3BPI8_HETP5|nr:EGF-like domain-containing protein [Heterostelium album PN500]EFA76706.1 EGF-like domain-containing protein [Heterostelium album PN500]|eukprot:XP_020428838.1 EGF-like domain-containing protein [Heterostelium album PN500]